MEIAQDEQTFEREDRASSSNTNEGRFFSEIPERLFLRPRPSYPNPTNATSSSNTVRPRRFTPTFSREPPHAHILYGDFTRATGPGTTFQALMEEAEQNDACTHHHLEVHRMFHDVAEAFF
jgi:hypothetical protein